MPSFSRPCLHHYAGSLFLSLSPSYRQKPNQSLHNHNHNNNDDDKAVLLLLFSASIINTKRLWLCSFSIQAALSVHGYENYRLSHTHVFVSEHLQSHSPRIVFQAMNIFQVCFSQFLFQLGRKKKQ